MSSESYLARWNIYLNSQNKEVAADRGESVQPDVEESEVDSAIDEVTSLDVNQVD